MRAISPHGAQRPGGGGGAGVAPALLARPLSRGTHGVPGLPGGRGRLLDSAVIQTTAELP